MRSAQERLLEAVAVEGARSRDNVSLGANGIYGRVTSTSTQKNVFLQRRLPRENTYRRGSSIQGNL